MPTFKGLFRLLKYIFAPGRDIPAEDLEAFFAGQTYPPNVVLDKLATQTDQDTAFTVACACCLAGLLGAVREFRGTFPKPRSEVMVVVTIEGWANMYRNESGTKLTVEELRKRILDAWTKISGPALEGWRTSGRKGNPQEIANVACFLIGRLDDETVSMFSDLICQKYRTAYGFYNTTLKNNPTCFYR